MKITKLNIPEVMILEPKVFNDERGFFYESFNQKKFLDVIDRDIRFVQDNHSKSKKGVLRGLHYQIEPFSQAKLVRVIQGEIYDVAIDLRENSDTYGKWVSQFLSSENKYQMWIPEGFAHGFLVMSDEAEVIYKTNNYYSVDHEKTIHWRHNSFNINWPLNHNLILTSKKDS